MEPILTERKSKSDKSNGINHVENESPLILTGRGDGVICVFSAQRIMMSELRAGTSNKWH